MLSGRSIPRRTSQTRGRFCPGLHTAVTLGGISGVLMGMKQQSQFISSDPRIQQVPKSSGSYSGGVLLAAAMLMTCYAMFTFRWRARMIRHRRDGPYYDRFGPFLLGVLVVAAMGTILGFGIYTDFISGSSGL